MAIRLNASPIEALKKGGLRRLRRAGYIPISIQHRGEPTRHYKQEARPLDESIRKYGPATLFEISLPGAGQAETVLVQAIQRHPVTHRLVQVSYQRVSRDEKLKAHVPILMVGEPEEVRSGMAIVEHPTEQIEIQCLPADLPGHITVDISELTHVHPLRVADLPSTANYEILTPPDTVLVALVSTARSVSEEMAQEAVEEPEAESAAEEA